MTVKRVSPEAYDEYLRGRYALRQLKPDAIRSAMASFERAIVLDPTFAAAHASLADAYLRYARLYELDPSLIQVLNAKSIAAAHRALELDSSNVEPYAVLASKHFGAWEWDKAGLMLERALEVDASNAETQRQYAYYLTAVGHVAEAVVHIKRAVSLDPYHAGLNSAAFWPFYCARDFDGALDQLRRARELDPNFHVVWVLIGRVYAGKGMPDEAIAALSKGLELIGEHGAWHRQARALMGYAHATAGRRREALAIAREFGKPFDASRDPELPAGALAMLYAALGDHDASLSWLAKGVEDRESFTASAGVAPEFDSLRSDPRFQDVLTRIGAAGALVH